MSVDSTHCTKCHQTIGALDLSSDDRSTRDDGGMICTDTDACDRRNRKRKAKCAEATCPSFDPFRGD